MATEKDKNLNPLFEIATDEDLLPLVEVILENISNSLESNEEYERYPDKPKKYIPLLVEEIRALGGHTEINFFRREGVPYSEIVLDVSEKLDIKISKNYKADDPSKVYDLEWRILTKILEDAYSKMKDSEKKDFQEFLVNNGFSKFDLKNGLPLTMILSQIGIQSSGFMAYQMAAIVSNGIAKTILGHGLKFAVNSSIMKGISIFAGPIGWAISGLWTALDLAGPAYRTTIPLVCLIATIRLKYSGEDEVSKAYATLEISQDSNCEEIKTAFKNKMNEYHPDKVHNLGSELKELAKNKTIKINEAYKLLKSKKCKD